MRFSISSRIVVLIIAGAIMILIAFGIIGRAIFSDILDDDINITVLNNIQQLTLTNEKLNLKRVQALASELDFPVAYQGGEGIWHSQDRLEGWHEISFRPIRGPKRPHKNKLFKKEREEIKVRPSLDVAKLPFIIERGWFDDYLVFAVVKDNARVAVFVDMDENHGVFYRYILLALLLFGGIIILIILGVKRLTRPIGQLTKAVNAIGEGNFAKRVNWQRQDELGDLGRSVDDMAAHIEGMLDAKRDLLLAIAHEIKTPLTRAKLMATLNDGKGIDEELNEINRVLDQLLEGERVDAGHARLTLSTFNLSAMLQELVSHLDANWSIQIAENVILVADENRINVALGNILKNAQKYGAEKRIEVTLKVKANTAEITVADQGGGVSANDLMRLGEAFTRLDPSRDRKSGGLGLGIYLTKRIINAHKGEVTFSNNDKNGLTVRLQIPMTLKA